MISNETTTTLNADYVEFRTPTNFGCQVVKVFTQLQLPRILAYGEWVSDDIRRRDPMSLPLDEIIEFSKRAFALSNKDLCLQTVLQALESKPSREPMKD